MDQSKGGSYGDPRRSLPVWGLFLWRDGENMNTNIRWAGAQEDLLFDEHGNGIITTEQTLTDEFWEDLKEAKEEFHFRLNGLTPVASIPEALVNKWYREGFDFNHAPASEIIKKLRIDGYDDFIVSGDKTF